MIIVLCKSSALHEHELNYSMTVAPYCFMLKESKMNLKPVDKKKQVYITGTHVFVVSLQIGLNLKQLLIQYMKDFYTLSILDHFNQ